MPYILALEREKGTNFRGIREKIFENSFTIHGLWPETQQWDPVHCKRTTLRAVINDKKMENEMHKLWPSRDGHGDGSFWAHEWNYHGCIADGVRPEEYFKKALKAGRRFAYMRGVFSKRLNDDDIMEKKQMEKVLGDIFGVRPIIIPGRELYGKQDVRLIRDIYICLNDKFKPINCPYSAQRKLSGPGNPLITFSD